MQTQARQHREQISHLHTFYSSSAILNSCQTRPARAKPEQKVGCAELTAGTLSHRHSSQGALGARVLIVQVKAGLSLAAYDGSEEQQADGDQAAGQDEQ